MAPSKILNEQPAHKFAKSIAATVSSKMGRMTRSQTITSNENAVIKVKGKGVVKDTFPKRKSDMLSPPKGKVTKRPALASLHNVALVNEKGKANQTKKTSALPGNECLNPKFKENVKITTIAQPKQAILVNIKSSANANIENEDPSIKIKPVKQIQVAVHKETKDKKTDELKEADAKYDSIFKVTSSGKPSNKFRRSLDACHDKSDESSLYTSALEDMSQESAESSKILSPVKKTEKSDSKDKKKEPVSQSSKAVQSPPSPKVPEGIEDFDKENMMDPIQVSNYAMEIFEYMKKREVSFRVDDYMSRQVLISKWMRSLLVNWMVEVQESFELNHETLYLGVKITDIYLNKVVVGKEILQLVGAASLFIASKYDERLPPLIDDFIFICDKAFTREDIIRMEMNVFRVIGYNLGIPLSYRFLRRFARCCKATMPTLTLARYILELSLMEYHLIFVSESKLACAALYLALKMKNISSWTPTLEYYSGYKLHEFLPIALDLNSMLHRKPREQLKTIRNKYSHKIFFEVAKTPLIEDSELCTDEEPETAKRV